MELVLSAGTDLAADKDGQRVKGATAPMVAMDSTVALKVILAICRDVGLAGAGTTGDKNSVIREKVL